MARLNWNIEHVANTTNGVVQGKTTTTVQRVATDSREDQEDVLYLALKGERFDGHDFVKESIHKGASAVLVDHPIDGATVPQIIVTDTLVALQALGTARRVEWGGPLVAITGSSGKTTTRKITASILSQRLNTHQPIRNFNNHIGVPLTLLELETEHQIAVLELGCSDFGEIGTLTKISQPDFGLVTNVGPAHLERLGDLDGVSRAKGELFAGLGPDATALVNADDSYVLEMPINCHQKLLFGRGQNVAVKLIDRLSLGAKGQSLVMEINNKELTAILPLFGAHNALDALAATTVAQALEITAEEIISGLSQISPEAGRLEPAETNSGVIIIDDTYNANPASMSAAIETLAEISGNSRTVAVLGDMLELGATTTEAHLAIGQQVAKIGLDTLITLGPGGEIISRGALDAGISAKHCTTVPDHKAAAELAGKIACSGDVILVKGSRGMHMEKIVAQLLDKRG
jgi:UDP-N-acetylmuramoyl-tripeptide--D-alanyl-D-alanine ligase